MPVPKTLFTTLALASAAAALAPGHAFPQDSAEETASAGQPPAAAPEIEEIEVRGRRMDEIEFDLRLYTRDFVEEIAAPARGRGFARWHRNVCIGVHNLEQSAAQYIVDRVSSVALEVGLEPGEPGCSPQVNIIFATDAKEAASYMVEVEPRFFRPVGGHAGTDLGLQGLDQFVESDRAVRWWHVSMPVDARTGAPAIQVPQSNCPQLHCPPTISVAGPSRLHSGIRDDLQYALIFVDATKLTGTTWQQLGDYLAVVSLAQIDPNADPADFDSILNLFRNPAAYSGLTDWDRSYIQALYSFNQERTPHLQGNELITLMVERERQPGE